MAAFVVVKIKI